MNENKKQYLDSEKYRQMLVKDGEKRFQEWHNKFIKYQKNFLDDLEKKRASFNN